MEEERLLASDAGGRNWNYGSMLQAPTFTLPLTRYTTLLIAANNHRNFRGDYAESEGEGDRIRTVGTHYGCAYLNPILVLDLIWNLAFVFVCAMVLLSTFSERTSTPLRVWLCGYAFQCILHVGSLYSEYWKRSHDFNDAADDGFSFSYHQKRIVKKLESMNAVISSIWWVFGFYWIVVGGQAQLHDCPRLYWLTIVFLAFDMFFIIFSIGMAFVVFLALCCCVPIIAMAYALTTREGASEEDIRSLPRYRFQHSNSSARATIHDNNENKQVVRATKDLNNNRDINQLFLDPEDSECCICLSQYVDGVELYCLPCNHHFHGGCISRWLRINATCPLCKYNILRGDTLV